MQMDGPVQTVAALFVATGGCYFEDGLGVDPWDEPRDARLYDGPHPVLCHSPCSRWSKLAPINQKRYGHAVGDDGGCFKAALAAVRTWGGVLEHPAHSLAWRTFGLQRPARSGWSPCDRGWACEVSQGAYGHRAIKQTWLYYVGGRQPFDLDWSRVTPTAQISFCRNRSNSPLPRLSKKEASATPVRFRDTLIALARWSAEGR